MPLPLLIPAAMAAYNLISGAVKKGKANKLAKENKRPTAVIPDEVKINQQISRDMAQEGLPAAQYAKAQQEIEKSAAAATGAATERKGGLATVSTIQANTDAAKSNLVAQDAAARVGNIKNMMSRNDVTAQWKDKVWDYNERQKYEENAAAIRGLRGAAAADTNTGLEMGASTAAMALESFGGKGSSDGAMSILGGKKSASGGGGGSSQDILSKLDPATIAKLLPLLGL